MKLKYLLSLSFVLISALPLIVGLYYFNEQHGRHTRAQFADHLASISLIARKRIEAAIARIEDNTALVASRTQLRLSLAQWNRDGDPSQRERIAKIIDDARSSVAHLRRIAVYDARGRLVTSLVPAADAAEIDPVRSYESTIKLVPADSGIEVVSHTSLVLDMDIIGYIRLVFHGDFIHDLVRDRSGLGNTGEWLFAVRHESGDALFTIPLKYDHRAAFVRRVPRDRTDIPITQALLGNEIVMENTPDYRERPVMAATRYINRLDWGLVAKIDEAEVNQHIVDNNRLIYFVEIALIVLAGTIGIGFAVYLSSPMESLRVQSSRVAQGELEELRLERGWHELRDLTEHFNHVIRSLRSLSESLDAKVRSRTRELEIANQRLAEMASLDPLTSLLNRRAFDVRYSEEFGRARRYRHALAVIMLDIDHFKRVNDTYGHAVGDRVLGDVASYLRSSLRESDIIARVGGEEFCLVLPEFSARTSFAFLERIRLDISAIEFNVDDSTFQVTCSLGAAYLDAETTGREDLLAKADRALYQAKQLGRDRVVEYSVDRKIARLPVPAAKPLKSS